MREKKGERETQKKEGKKIECNCHFIKKTTKQIKKMGKEKEYNKKQKKVNTDNQNKQ